MGVSTMARHSSDIIHGNAVCRSIYGLSKDEYHNDLD